MLRRAKSANLHELARALARRQKLVLLTLATRLRVVPGAINGDPARNLAAEVLRAEVRRWTVFVARGAQVSTVAA
eukprot:5239172-Alexandrium_andersonii.AAC.1